MSRLPHLTPGDLPPEYRPLLEALSDARGFVPNVYAVMAHMPAHLSRFLDFTAPLRADGAIPATEKELVILLVGHLTGAQTILDAHRGFARAAGLSTAFIEAIPTWRNAPSFSDRQRAMLAYTEAVTTQIRVDDRTWDAVASYLDNAGLAELTLTVATYNMVARFLEPLAIDRDSRYLA